MIQVQLNYVCASEARDRHDAQTGCLTSLVCHFAGGLETMLGALNTSRSAAKVAFELLECASSTDHLRDLDVENNLRKLAELQAVHVCSRLLCPPIPAAASHQASTGTFYLLLGSYTTLH